MNFGLRLLMKYVRIGFHFFDGRQGHRVDGVPDNFDDYLEQVLAAQEKYRKEHDVKC